MYQLSHMLTEQRTLLSSLASSSVAPAVTLQIPQNDLKHKDSKVNVLVAIAEKVEGCVVSMLVLYFIYRMGRIIIFSRVER